MIAPWNGLNARGKILATCCLINLMVAIYVAVSGSYMSLFSIAVAMFCGMSTYSPRSQYVDAADINNRFKDEEL
tara:strand:- start:521 stop:742 length:222 start_codon:yes stop_codon:yes gene_type:complete